jgi:hypothetical protein
LARNMSPEQAQALAEKYQERYPDASPREIAAIVNDPMQHFNEPILGNVYRGIRVPSNMSAEQSDAWRAAVDQRMEGFEGREAARRADARRRLNEEIRSNIAGVVKPASMAASVTPYDLGLGDVGYAAGELIDPEGTYGDAALAAGGGLLTAGIGSGAIMSKAAKEARKGMKRADDFEDSIPTDISTPYEIIGLGAGYKSRAARDAKAYADSMRTPPRDLKSKIQNQMRTRFGSPPPELAIGVGGAAAIGALGKERLREQQEADLNGVPAFDRDRTFEAAAGLPGVPDEVSMSDWHATGRASDMPTEYYDSDAPYGPGTGDIQVMADPNLSVAMMNEVRKTTDYGRGFAESTERHNPSNYSSADQFRGLSESYESMRNDAARIFEQTGTVPAGLARSLGKTEAMMNTRGALINRDDQMLREGMSPKMAGSGGMESE